MVAINAENRVVEPLRPNLVRDAGSAEYAVQSRGTAWAKITSRPTGEMSIIHPRSHPLNLNSQYDGIVERNGNRHKVKPGISGPAQICGLRGPTTHPAFMRQRVAYDLQYIENWSIWLDVKIIAATPFLGIINRSAF